MATTVITKSSINVQGGGGFNNGGAGTGGIGLSTGNGEYAIINCTSTAAAADAVIIGSYSFTLGSANQVYTLYVPPNTSVQRFQSGANTFTAVWTIFNNT